MSNRFGSSSGVTQCAKYTSRSVDSVKRSFFTIDQKARLSVWQARRYSAKRGSLTRVRDAELRDGLRIVSELLHLQLQAPRDRRAAQPREALDLRVVARHHLASRRRHERLADAAPVLGADRDVLQVRVGG